MHHIFIEEKSIDLINGIVLINCDRNSSDLENDTFNHLVNSVRVKVGEKVLCSVNSEISSFDYICKVENITKDVIELSVEEKSVANELSAEINLYQGITKFDKFEFIIEKSVELGVKSITPFFSEYCVVKFDDNKAVKKIERFNKISKSAAEQSKRHMIPKVNEPINFNEMINKISDNNDTTYNLLFYENAEGIIKTRDILKKIVNKSKDSNVVINVIIGPEGGFSYKEIELAKNSNVSILSLGDRILRTETASLTAMSIIMYELQ